MSGEAPKVGDKVLYVNDAPIHRAWEVRTRKPSLVIDGPRSDGYLRMFRAPDDDWFAPGERLCVVERATYTAGDPS